MPHPPPQPEKQKDAVEEDAVEEDTVEDERGEQGKAERDAGDADSTGSRMFEDGIVEVDEVSVRETEQQQYEGSGYEDDSEEDEEGSIAAATSISEHSYNYCSSANASLSSSMNEYVFEHGRRYHAYFGIDKNLMPTDEVEQDRLDLHHEVLLGLLDGALHLAPVEGVPERVIDVGTGTGIWAMDAADKWPGADVVGTDLSPIQPQWMPPNCRFEVDDVEEEWPYQDGYFDFIHARNLAQAVTGWPDLMAEMYRCAKPGGHIELAEVGGELVSDDDVDGDNHFRRWYDLVYSTAYPKAGRAPVTAELLQERLEEAGFKEVEVVAYRHPFGPWSKDPKMKQLGAVVLLQCESGIEAYSLAPLTRWLGMEVEEVHKLCRDALEEVKTSKRHMYNYFFVAHGRKPDDDEVDDVENNKEDEEEEDDHGRRHNHGRRSCKH